MNFFGAQEAQPKGPDPLFAGVFIDFAGQATGDSGILFFGSSHGHRFVPRCLFVASRASFVRNNILHFVDSSNETESDVR